MNGVVNGAENGEKNGAENGTVHCAVTCGVKLSQFRLATARLSAGCHPITSQGVSGSLYRVFTPRSIPEKKEYTKNRENDLHSFPRLE